MAASTGALFDAAVHSVEDDQRLDAVVDLVHEVAAGVARSAVGPYLRGRPLGHALHPLMTDVPIGCWTSAALLDLSRTRHVPAGGGHEPPLNSEGPVTAVTAGHVPRRHSRALESWRKPGVGHCSNR